MEELIRNESDWVKEGRIGGEVQKDYRPRLFISPESCTNMNWYL